jgi:hypothetical protein
MAGFLNALLGLPQSQQPLIYWGFAQNGYIHEAVRIGNLKGVRMFGQPTELYDVSADPFETVNIAEQYPGVITQVEGVFNRVCVEPKRCAFVPMAIQLPE